MAILTDAQGRPFERPDPPAPGAPPQEFTAYLRADAAYRDRVAACVNCAFDRAFRKAIRK